MVESALRSRRLTSKELGHVIMCAYGAPAGIFNGRVLRDIPSRGQCLTCCVPASHSRFGTWGPSSLALGMTLFEMKWKPHS